MFANRCGSLKRSSSLTGGGLGVVFLILTVLLVASCAKPPEAELSAAEADLDRARESEAPTYASVEMRAAEDSLAAARNEVDRQKAKFSLFRNYSDATEKILGAQETARAAAEAAVQNKERMRTEAAETLVQVQDTIAGVREMFDSRAGKRLTRAKGQREAVMEIKAELDAIEANLDNIRQSQTEERFNDAFRMATDSFNRADALRQEVAGAIEKMTAGS